MPAMPDDGRRIGAHLPLAAGMVRAADRAHEIGATAIAVFADNPSAWRRRGEPAAQLAGFRDRLADHGIAPTVIHAAYLANLAGPDGALFERSVAVMTAELEAAPGYGARYVNAHTGSHRGAGLVAGIERLADGIARVLEAVDDGPESAMLVLENAAGGGGTIGATVEELASVAEAIALRGVAEHRVGFCLDSAHAWAAGHRIDDEAGVERLLDAFDTEIGLARLVLVHLNDSRSAAASHADRHEHLGAGSIGEAGLGALLRHPRLGQATFILETPGMDAGWDAVNIARARDLLAGRPLTALPASAFGLPSGRSRRPDRSVAGGGGAVA